MSSSKSNAKSGQKAIGRLFPTLAGIVADKVGASRLETLELMTDVEQVSQLFSSMDDKRQGRVVSMSDAFGDL